MHFPREFCASDFVGAQHAAPLRPYFATPFGDMMIAGCFGLLAATTDVLPEFAEEIRSSLSMSKGGIAPWDVN